MSNVSPGAAYFHDPDGFGFIYHRAGSYGPGGHALPAGEQLAIALGAEGDGTMTERFCAALLAPRPPAIAVLWLSEPDNTGHASQPGSPAQRRAMAAADRCVARVLETVTRHERGGDEILTIICSDHGMETTSRTVDVTAALVAAGLKSGPDSCDVVVAPNGTAAVIYVAATARNRVAALRDFIAMQDWRGTVFSGTELAAIGLPADEAIGLAVSLRGSARANSSGVPMRSAGMRCSSRDSSSAFAFTRAIILVSICPGQMALKRTSRPNSSASACVSPISAAFEAQ